MNYAYFEIGKWPEPLEVSAQVHRCVYCGCVVEVARRLACSILAHGSLELCHLGFEIKTRAERGSRVSNYHCCRRISNYLLASLALLGFLPAVGAAIGAAIGAVGTCLALLLSRSSSVSVLLTLSLRVSLAATAVCAMSASMRD